MNCVVCQTVMDPVLIQAGDVSHPHCDIKFIEAEGEDPFSSMLRSRLLDIVKWAEREAPRSKQQQVGPSELGTACDRRLGYRLAAIPACNVDFDPWPSIVGTAVHSWLELALQAWMRQHGSGEWSTETTLQVDDYVKGHSDLYWHEQDAVIDYKTCGPDVMKKIRKNGPPEGYQIQAHVYGYGYEQKGHPVKKVCLVFLPRAGWLRDMFIWHAPYERDVGVGAISRLYEIATQVTEKQILMNGNSYRWEQIDATPSNDCGFCPWYDPGRDLERGADHTGCPGR